jgi:hypothetical protein
MRSPRSCPDGMEQAVTAPGKRQQEPPSWRSQLVAVVRRRPWLTAATATLVCGGGLVAADAVFLAGFGLTPWEVGHSAVELLLQAPLLLLLLVAGGTLGDISRVAQRAGWPTSAEAAGDLARVGLLLVALAVGLAWLVAPVQAAWARERVRDGQKVWMETIWPRPFQVAPASVAGVGGYVPPAAVTGDGARLLAASSDRYWLYVSATRETVGVPARRVVLIVEPRRVGGGG